MKETMKKVLSLMMAMVICICSASFVFAASGSGATQQPGDIEIDIGGGGLTAGTQSNPLVVTADTTFKVNAGKTYYIVVNDNDGMTLTITGATGFTVNQTADTQGVYAGKVNGEEVVYAVANTTGVTQTYSVKLEMQFAVAFSTPAGVSDIQDMTSGVEGITLPSADAPKGYTFVGWATQAVEDAVAEPQTYAAGSVYVATEDVTLIAAYSYTVPGLNKTYYTTEKFCDHQWDDGVAGEDKVTYTCGTCGSTKVKILGIPGDCNGDMQVDNEDVIYLLWHTLFPETYPMEAYADFARDGQVNNEDVIYLLWHTLFPESYPLA